jgi:phosphoribosylaminoimidazolecarboxamide formyltransferase/IMP cyclohydrolase
VSASRRRALISVFRKEGIEVLARRLAAAGFEIVSTGGTARHLAESGVAVVPVEAVTGFPEMMDGRVKTLHPLLHAGILYRRDVPAHVEAARRHAIVPIDVVAVNLYPFAETLASGAAPETVIEMIDVGGPAMVRAAAKNHAHVTVLVDPDDYLPTLEEIEREGAPSATTRRRLAARAFEHVSAYDAEVAAWLAAESSGAEHPATLRLSFARRLRLRYGENPHQRGSLYAEASPAAGSLTAARVLQGKEMSFNNYLDLDAAWALAWDFDRPAAVVVKHNNPCGVALSDSLTEAYRLARAADSLSAFGGIVAVNRGVDRETAVELTSTFIEAVIAPAFDAEARQVLAAKPGVRVLEAGHPVPGALDTRYDLRRISGGLLYQDADFEPDGKQERVITRRSPSPPEWEALRLAWTVARRVRSNAIVYARPGRTVGIGAGQMSRVDAARLGALKGGDAVRGSVLASDAFFPFRDGIDAAAEAGVTAVVQPGGSIRDEEVIAAANEAGMAMVFTGTRHFRH